MPIFNHVQIKVKDINISRKFYDAIMSALGYTVVFEIKDVVIGYGTSTNDMFEIRQASDSVLQSEAVHICFNAKGKKEVDSFYSKALDKGSKTIGEPGYRPEYAEGYYACFVRDPDGHNIEAVSVES